MGVEFCFDLRVCAFYCGRRFFSEYIVVKVSKDNIRELGSV